MNKPTVLRVPRSDDESAFVLIAVTATGSRALDLKLLGTEGSEPYALSLRHDRDGSLKAPGGVSSDAEWRTILEAVLHLEPLPDIQVEASVQAQSSLVITIRRNHEGITQRLGALVLSYSPAEEIELFDWCAASVGTCIKAKADLAASKRAAQALERAVEELKSQFAELVEAKREHELELLDKFRALLNEKKAKIRDLHTQLASAPAAVALAAQPSPAAPDEPASKPATRAKTKTKPTRRAVAPSRPPKRKTRASAKIKDEDGDEDRRPDGHDPQHPEQPPLGQDPSAERMDVDQVDVSDDPSEQRDTTEDEDATASEDDGEAVPAPTVAVPPVPAAPSKNNPLEPPPPPRNLPFNPARKSRANPVNELAPKASQPDPGSETESDEEL